MNILKISIGKGTAISERNPLLINSSSKSKDKKNYCDKYRPVVAEIYSPYGVIKRAVLPISVKLKLYFSDCITGSIYEARSGECLTTTKLQLLGVKKDFEDARNIILDSNIPELARCGGGGEIETD